MNTGGSWNGVHSWASPTTETINGSVEYHYSLTFGTSRIAYRTIDKTWYDSDTSSQPSALSSDAFSTQSSELVNPQYVWIGDTSATNTDFYISFDNPYYEAIEPQTITPTTVNNSWTGATYVWKETVGTSEIYTLAFNGVATNNNHEIQVDTITNTWSDYGTNNPNTVTDNGSTVTLSSGTTTFVVFNKPTSASWL